MRWILFSVVFFVPYAIADEATTLESLVEKWLNLESQKGKLVLEWKRRKNQIESDLKLFGEEKKALESLLDKASKATSEVDQRRLSLLDQQAMLEREQEQVDEIINLHSDLVAAFNTRLPPPLASEWSPKLALLSNENASGSEKLERILSYFKAIEDFNSRVALHQSPLQVNDGGSTKNILVTQIFLGVSQAWYVSDDGSYFGYGRATSAGWNWWHKESLSSELGQELDVSELLLVKSILENPTAAEFVTLPIKLAGE
jgi:hypothetical protein